MHVFRTILNRGEDEARFEEAVAAFLDERGLATSDAPLTVPTTVDELRVERSVLLWSSEAVREFERFWDQGRRKYAVDAALGAVLARLNSPSADQDL